MKIHTETPVLGEKRGVPYTTGAFGIQVAKNIAYFDINFSRLSKTRGGGGFIKSKDSDDVPKFNTYPVLTRKKSWRHEMSLEEVQEMDPLMDQIAALRKINSGPWVNGLHLSCVFVQHRIQPLQNRAHPMWEYSGPRDITQTKADELSLD